MAKKPLKITIFHCTLIYNGGGERIVFGQLEGLKKRGYDVSCFAPVIDKEYCYPDIISRYPVYSFLPQLPGWFPFRHATLLVITSFLAPLLALRFKDTDLFIGENQPGTWLAFVISRVLGKPYIIYTCHPNRMIYTRSLTREQIWKTQPDFYWLSVFFEPFKPILKFLDKLSFTQSGQTVLTNGYFIGRQFGRAYKVEWRGCPSGAPIVGKRKLSKRPETVFEGSVRINGVTIEKPYLLFIGRHEVWKRIDLAIKAMAKIVEKFPRVTLVIPGRKTLYTQDLVRLTKCLGISNKVLFIDDTSQLDLRKLYREAAVYLFTSKKEDFGIVMVEAMGAGVPVVAWDAGGPRDIVVDGETGFLARPFDLDDFVRKTLKLLGDPELRFKMGRAGWKRARREFSWKKHLDVLEEEIGKALKISNNIDVD